MADDLLLADVSEWQGIINWVAYPSLAAIVRLNYGSQWPDLQCARNIAGARARCRVRGWYTYLVAGQAPEPQADLLVHILQEHGGLLEGEFVVCDDEEGDGDQAPRVDAFLNRVHAALNESAGQDWVYAGLYFARTHLGHLSGRHRWLAAYGSSEMGDQHDLWQFTSSASVAGIAGKVDCSIYHGTIDQLLSLVGGDMAGLTGDEHNWLEDLHKALPLVRDVHNGMGGLMSITPDNPHPLAFAIRDEVGQVDQKVSALQIAPVDPKVLAQEIVALLPPGSTASAKEIVDEIARRWRA